MLYAVSNYDWDYSVHAILSHCIEFDEEEFRKICDNALKQAKINAKSERGGTVVDCDVIYDYMVDYMCDYYGFHKFKIYNYDVCQKKLDTDEWEL